MLNISWSGSSTSSTVSLASNTSSSEEFWSQYKRGYKPRSFWKKVVTIFQNTKKIQIDQQNNEAAVSLYELYESLNRSFTVEVNEEYGTILEEKIFNFPPPLPSRMSEMQPPPRPPVSL